MAIRDVFRINFKTFFNPKAWIDYNNLKLQGVTLYSLIKNLFVTNKPTHSESFEDAKKRLRLSEKDLHRMNNHYRIYAWLFVFIGLAIFAYAFYLLFAHRTFTGWILGLAVTSLFFAQAFRFDFWSYQIRRRKLGVTFDEWYRSVMGDQGGKS